MKTLACLGAGGHGKVVADVAESAGWENVVFFDDRWPEITTNGPWKVLGDNEALMERLSEFDAVFVSIGNNCVRKAKFEHLALAGAKMATLKHSSAVISKYSELGQGSIIMAGAVINAGAEIKEGAIINTACIVEHEASIGSFVHLSPNSSLAGNVTVGNNSWIGIGSIVKESVNIGDEVVVGAGAVVINDVPSGETVVGIPARPI